MQTEKDARVELRDKISRKKLPLKNQILFYSESPNK